jgi:hypothetical protein
MGKWGFRYVENICWMQMSVNGNMMKRDSDYLPKSHLSCFIFRKVLFKRAAHFSDHVTMTQSLHAEFCVDINISEFPLTRLRNHSFFCCMRMVTPVCGDTGIAYIRACVVNPRQ